MAGGEPLRVLLEGRPGVGKTTVARRLLALLRAEGTPLAGFTTEEIREGRRRVGFAVESVSGDRGVLAHADLPGPPRVGRYGVDVEAFERIALPALADPGPGGVVVVDELGKMELASPAFREAVLRSLEGSGAFVATVHAHRHPFTDALKRRLEVVRVTHGNRDALPERLAARLAGPRAEKE